MPRPVVFLDFDGVLNTPTRWGQNPPESALEPALVRRVSRFCDRAGACVVVSSTWRIDHSVERLRGFLATAGFARTERIIDVTPDFCGRPRQDEILAWLEQTSTSSAWVILDDDSLGDRQWENTRDSSGTKGEREAVTRRHPCNPFPTMASSSLDSAESDLVGRHGARTTPMRRIAGESEPLRRIGALRGGATD